MKRDYREKPVNQIRIVAEEMGSGAELDTPKKHGSCLGTRGEEKKGVLATPRLLTWEWQVECHEELRQRRKVGSRVGEGRYGHGELRGL